MADRQSFNYDSRLKNCCDEVVEMIPDGKCFDALAEVCELLVSYCFHQNLGLAIQLLKLRKRKLNTLNSEQEACKSMLNLQSGNATEDDSSYFAIVEEKPIESIGYTFQNYFNKGWLTGEVIDIVGGRKEILCL